jgi:eukaryotic-like serine/threonine-protein kinase
MQQIPKTANDLLRIVVSAGLYDAVKLKQYAQNLLTNNIVPADAMECAQLLICDGLLTEYQARVILQGGEQKFMLGSKYRVLDLLGEGGMGTVYLCEHKHMRRRVAIKVLSSEKCQNPVLMERFQKEARAVAMLDDPNIVRAHDVDWDGKVPFLVMEYVEGTNLQKLIEDNGPLHHSRAVNYMAQTTSGLHHAFEAGLVHRDIKPANILVDRRGIIKILDLGLARLAHESEAHLTNPEDGGLLGTADYLAPEQALNASTVDVRADIYSLGATMYFLLTGKPPFPDGTVAQKLIKHQTVMPKAPNTFDPEIPQGLNDVVMRMMAKNPNNRYATPGEVFDALQPWLQSVNAPTANELPGARFSSHGDINLETMDSAASMSDTTPLATKKPKTMSSFELPPVGAKTVLMRKGQFVSS